jgi:hypothetical protein
MISRPAHWTAVHGVTTQTLIAPEGAEAAGIRYTERVRPLMRIGDIVADWLRRHHHLTHTSVGEPERLLTVEGEHAGLVVIDGAYRGKPAQTSLGLVFGDDFYARIEGFALRRELFASTLAMVRQLTATDRHVLGRRRRRYEHTSPAGWQPITRGFATDWLAPGFPLRMGLLVVYPATPVESVESVDLSVLAARAVERGFEVFNASPPVEVDSGRGLRGIVNEMVGTLGDRRMLRAFVTLTDQRYLYSAELLARTEDDWPEHRAAFTELWRSIVPIPGPEAASAAAFEYWVE